MEKRTSRTAAAAFIAAICLTSFALAGCKASPAAREQAVQAQSDLTAPVAVSGAELQRYHIRDWAAPNDHTLILIADDGSRYRAQTIGPCQGLDFASRVGFANRGGFNRVDRFSSVVLDDGTRCAFTSFDKLKTPEAKALDDYEKAAESKSTQDASGGQQSDSKPK